MILAFLPEGQQIFIASEEALRELHLNAASLKKAAMRLAAKAGIAVPRRGFYAIFPVEYRVAGAPPPTWFIDGLMLHLGRPYYAGLLSAAALYGAAHQQPQEFQVITDQPQRLMRVGRSRIRFLVKKNIKRVSIAADNRIPWLSASSMNLFICSSAEFYYLTRGAGPRSPAAFFNISRIQMCPGS